MLAEMLAPDLRGQSLFDDDAIRDNDVLFKPELFVDDTAIAPPAVTLKNSDKGAGAKTFRKRIKEGLMPEVLDVSGIQDDTRPDVGLVSARSGKGSPILTGKGSPPHTGGKGSPPLTGGKGSPPFTGGRSAYTGRDRRDMIFAETPLWCGAPFANQPHDDWPPFGEKIRDLYATPAAEKLPYYDPPYELPPYDDGSTADRSTAESRSPPEEYRVKPKQKHDKHPSAPPIGWESVQPDWPGVADKASAQVQYVPVPVPMSVPPGRDGAMWNNEDQLGAAVGQKQAPVMIPVPVPVPVPMGCGDSSAAVNASFAAAAGQDMYNALLNAYPRGFPQAPPPGFVPPPGYKLVPAMNPIDMYQSAHFGRQDIHHDYTVREKEKKFPAPTRTSRSNNRSAKSQYGKVFVGGLSPATSVEMLRDHFSSFGRLTDVSVIKDPVTKLSRGFGFVEFEGGIPPNLLEAEHMIDKRKCGVKQYTYEVG
jgi:hypothetical protein